MAPKKVIFVSVLAALFCLATATRAALQFDAFLGYDNIVPERSWFPVTCELQNDGPPFNAVIEVSADEFGRAGLVRRFPIDLPTNTRKRICIPVFSSAGRWDVKLIDEHGKVRGDQVLDQGHVIKNSLPLVAGLARTSAGLPVFPEFAPSIGQDEKYNAARLQPALFPENPLALEGIDLLYLSSERAANLSIGQVNALVAWLQRGGHLVLGVEQLADVNGTPWLKDLLPCELTSIVTLNSHDALTAWAKRASTATVSAPIPKHNPNLPPGNRFNTKYPALQATPSDYVPGQTWNDDADFDSAPLQAATGTLRDGTYLIGDATTPFAIEGLRGRGKITVLMFDPEREPIVSWKNRAWLWAGIAGIPGSAFKSPYATIRASRLSSDGVFGSMIDTKQVRKLPLGWLLVLLAAYLAIIGPVDQYWLKKINRQMLTWVTFPCYVVIFSGLIYYIGFHLRAGDLEWNELDVVDILPDSDRAVLRGETYVSIYSPINSDYELAGQEKFASLRGEYLGNFGGSQESSRAEIMQTGNNFDAEAYVPVWTSQLLVSDWVQPGPVPLTMTASQNGGTWTLTVENKLDHELTNAAVVLGGTFYNLGSLNASAKKTFTLTPNQGMPVEEMARQYMGAFQQAIQSRHNSFGNNAVAIPDIAAGSMAASFIGYINNDSTDYNWNNFTAPATLDLSRFADANYGILLAWDQGQTLTPDLNRFQPKRLRRDTLLRLVTPVKLSNVRF